MNSNETVLLYNFSGSGKGLKEILLKMHVRIKLVEPKSYLEPIGFLAGIKSVPASHKIYTGENFPDRMLVMRGFTGNRIDELLFRLRKEKLPPIPLKAVITEHNLFWDSIMLHDELLKEHEAMKAAPQR